MNITEGLDSVGRFVIETKRKRMAAAGDEFVRQGVDLIMVRLRTHATDCRAVGQKPGKKEREREKKTRTTEKEGRTKKKRDGGIMASFPRKGTETSCMHDIECA